METRFSNFVAQFVSFCGKTADSIQNWKQNVNMSNYLSLVSHLVARLFVIVSRVR